LSALGLCEMVLGKGHPFTLTSINSLASALRDRGKCEQAEEAHRQVLGLRETVLDKQHPDILTSMKKPGECAEQSGQIRAGGGDASISARAEGHGAG
jgi:hypothetical protein